MELENATSLGEQKLLHCMRDVKIVRTYLVSTEHNAWQYSTSRHYPSMHSTLESAKEFCEGSRRQGMRFHVLELPSLAFFAAERALLVSEIKGPSENKTAKPLERLSLPRLRSLVTVLPVSTMTLQQVVYIFDRASPLWLPTRNNSSFTWLSSSARPQRFREVQSSDHLSHWMSQPDGPHYPLAWISCKWDEPNRTALKHAASILRERLGPV